MEFQRIHRHMGTCRDIQEQAGTDRGIYGMQRIQGIQRKTGLYRIIKENKEGNTENPGKLR